MPPINLPGYMYDTQTGRYISKRTGRPVSVDRLQALADEQGNDNERYLLLLLLSVVDGELAPSVFADLSAESLQQLHLQSAALGAGGWDALTASELGQIETDVRTDTRKLLATIAAVVAGSISIAVARERFRGYIGNARTQFFKAERSRLFRTSPSVVIVERRFLGGGRHCRSCVDYYRQGWQLQGVLPPPGVDSECGTHCRCRIVRREVPAGEVQGWLNSRRSIGDMEA